jgi:FimV-like protein
VNHRRYAVPGAIVLLLCAAAFLALHPSGGHTQATKPLPETYSVRSDDTILSIAQELCPPQATVNQMAMALVRANAEVFEAKSDRRLPLGATLKVPDLATVLKVDAATAQRQFYDLWRAEQHYRAGVSLERSKDMFYAFTSYVEAAKLGHGLAQLRLGQLYDNDLSGFVRRDLQESLRWYERARDQGVRIRSPGVRAPRGI